jgi:esterase/lipase superfamily enzyme
LKKINKGELKQDWVLFVHGFNQSFPDNLEKCKQIEKLYGVNVLAFSWPSNQGGLKLIEYKKARGASRGCTNAFDRMIEKLTEYLSLRDFTSKCEIRMSLMAYSLGNYVFENFVRSPIFSNETKIFDNIILTQADVDVETHAEWVGNLKYAKRVYVTINEDDRVLKWSDVPNPPRLGNTTKLLNAKNAVYFDFTNGKFVGSTHGLFYKTAKKNKVVKEIFQHALTGRRAERTIGIQYNTSTNAYELAEKAEKESTEWIHSAD